MGCWNETCAISNLHITAGQRVVVLALGEPLGQNPDYFEGGSYKPVPILWEGEYDDYGRAENQSGFGLGFFLKELKERLVEMEVGDNQYHDIAISKDALDETFIWEAHHEGRLRLTQRPGEKGETLIHLIMIHGEVYDAIVKEHTNEHFYYKSKGPDKQEFCYRDYTLAEVLETVPAYLKEVSKKIDESGYGTADLYFISHLLDNVFDNEIQDSEFPNLADIMFPGNHSGLRLSLISPTEQLIRIMMNESQETAIIYAEEILKFQWLSYYMQSIRKIFEPQAGRGSQSQEEDPYRLLANVVLKIVGTEKKAKWGEDEDEFFYEESQLELPEITTSETES
jgi:hypothetical protein